MKAVFLPAFFLAFLLTGCAPFFTTTASAPPSPTPTPATATAPEPTPTPTPTPEPTPEPYDYTLPVAESPAVDESWFSDAVFIGDSRTDGLRLYGGIKGTTFLCYKGLTVFEVVDNKPVIQKGGKTLGVLEALEQGSYEKVYISLGLNELGYNNDQGFADTYRSMVEQVRALQPDAEIYLQLVIPVSTERCKVTGQPYYVTNEQIAVYNDIIREIAVEQQVYLLDVGEVMVDETGELPFDASFDGIHFQKADYRIWYDYLKVHTVQEDTP